MKITYLMPLPSLFVMTFVLFLFFGTEPFSINAYIEPFMGNFALVSLILLVVCILDVIYLNLFFIPKLLMDPKTHVLAVSLTIQSSLFGFLIGFLNENFWVFLPFAAVSIGNYLIIYKQASEKEHFV